jgi:hypothetical protein
VVDFFPGTGAELTAKRVTVYFKIPLCVKNYSLDSRGSQRVVSTSAVQYGLIGLMGIYKISQGRK